MENYFERKHRDDPEFSILNFPFSIGECRSHLRPIQPLDLSRCHASARAVVHACARDVLSTSTRTERIERFANRTSLCSS